MDKNLLSLFMGDVKEKKKTRVIAFELKWDPDKGGFLVLNCLPDENRPYMTKFCVVEYSSYLKWEKIYLRKSKIDKLIEKIKK